MATMKSANNGKVAGTINITPLIDILLVLLVIFMTASSTTSKALETQIPQPSSERTLEQTEPPIIVSVDGRGVVQINQATFEGGLQPQLEQILRARRDRTVFVN